MARNSRNNRKTKEVVVESEQLIETPNKEESIVMTDSKERSIVMTDSEIAQKYHLDEHSWEGTVAIWKIRKELGIK